MEKVENLLEEVNIQGLQRGIEASYTTTLFPNYRYRWDASCLIEQEAEKVDNLTEEHRQLLSKPVLRGYKQRLDDIILETRKKEIGEIWECLTKTQDVKVICIHGIAGVGKTAVAKAICNRALDDDVETFSYVIWVDAEYGIKPKILQKKILKSAVGTLGTTGDIVGEDRKVYDELVQRKQCLLVFDFLWDEFSFEEIVEIPDEVDIKDINCKIIITSRLPSVGLQVPETKYVVMKPLCEVRSWQVFEAAMGDRLPMLREKVQPPMERKVVRDCGGLPLLVKSLAKRLRTLHEKSSDEMNSELKKILHDGGNSLLNDKQFKDLKYSYDKLDKIGRVCLLYCALYPKGSLIEAKALIEYWIGEGLLDENHLDSLEKRRIQGMDVLMKLQNVHLLEVVNPNSGKEMVKLVGLFYDMAVKIMHRPIVGFYTNRRDDLASFPDINDQHGNLQRASFVHHSPTLKREPNFPALLTLLLHNNPLNVVSHSFFNKILNLKVLDLSHTNILVLPRSTCNLEHLRILLLHCCSNLKYLPSLCKLEKLIILDLYGTSIEDLPHGIEKLKYLQRLDVSYTMVTKYPATLFDELEKLQELLIIMDDVEAYSMRSELVTSSSEETNVLIKNEKSSEETDVEKLARLEHLTALYLNFFNVEAFKTYMSSIPVGNPCRRSPCFKFCVGGVCKNRSILGENSIAFIGDYDDIDQLPEGTLELYLTMSHRTLRTIETPSTNFRNLKVMDVSECTSLTYLFSVEMVHCLLSLEKICVRRCWSLLGIIQPNPHDVLACSLPRLKELVLIELSSLESIDSEQQVTLQWPAFCTLSLWNCENLKMLPQIVSQDVEAINFRVRWKRSSLISLNLDNSHVSNIVFEDAEKPQGIVFSQSLEPTEREKTPRLMSKDDQANFFERKPGSPNMLIKNDGSQNPPQKPPQKPGYIAGKVNEATTLFGRILAAVN